MPEFITTTKALVQTKMPRFRLESPRPCTIFCFTYAHIPCMSYVINTFLLVSSSVGVNNHCCVLCTVKAKEENKNLQQRNLSGFIAIPLYRLWAHETSPYRKNAPGKLSFNCPFHQFPVHTKIPECFRENYVTKISRFLEKICFSSEIWNFSAV